MVYSTVISSKFVILDKPAKFNNENFRNETKEKQKRTFYPLIYTQLKQNMFHNILADHSPVYLLCEESFQAFVQYPVRFG